jgi:hypothetical protein
VAAITHSENSGRIRNLSCSSLSCQEILMGQSHEQTVSFFYDAISHFYKIPPESIMRKSKRQKDKTQIYKKYKKNILAHHLLN